MALAAVEVPAAVVFVVLDVVLLIPGTPLVKGNTKDMGDLVPGNKFVQTSNFQNKTENIQKEVSARGRFFS